VQERLKEMASVLMTQVETLISTAELMEPKAPFKVEDAAEEAALVRERYVSTCSEVQRQLQNVLEQIREKAPAAELEAELTHAINRLEELKRPYV